MRIRTITFLVLGAVLAGIGFLIGFLIRPAGIVGPGGEFTHSSDASLSAFEQDGSVDDQAGFPKGMCPFVVNLPNGSVRGGWVLPTWKVDVAWLQHGQPEWRETIILHNVLVWSVDARCWFATVKEPPPPTPITLAVSTQEAKQLRAALEQGTIKLVVLPKDEEIGDDEPQPP